jgi:hypothetical protein
LLDTGFGDAVESVSDKVQDVGGDLIEGAGDAIGGLFD